MLALKYHDIFDYKLTKEELVKWQYKNYNEKTSGIKNKSRIAREKYSQAKLIIARKAARLISKIPTVKFVGITGALAMMNAKKESDIDLLIITRQNSLWTTRFLTYLELRIMNYELRNPNSKKEKDKLCLNMWLDEGDLVWRKKDRNIYTAHEIAQIVPLINKDNTYEKFLYLNRWILDYWPNSVKIYDLPNSDLAKLRLRSMKYELKKTLYTIVEKLSFWIQYLYMRNKITREVVTPTRAIFHPHDWGSVVLNKLLNQKLSK